MTLVSQVSRLAAFTRDGEGGNPAGVWVGEAMPDAAAMQACALEVGYSETVFAARSGAHWRVRYFAPGREVPFCGHATIALGAVLAEREGDGVFSLNLNDGPITVESWSAGAERMAALQSPPTRHEPLSGPVLAEALSLLQLAHEDVDTAIAPAKIHAGADHLLLCLRELAVLARAAYGLEAGRAFMQREGLVTIALVHQSGPRAFDARNMFASGGVYEDPATGAAAAAFAGYLRDTGRLSEGAINLIQGEDMGRPSQLRAEVSPATGGSVRVSGAVAPIATPAPAHS